MPRVSCRTTLAAFGLVALACVPDVAPRAESDSPHLALINVQVVDVREGVIHAGSTVLLEGTRILAVGPSDAVAVPEGAHIVVGEGRFVIPGLWDMHVHTLWDPSLENIFLPLFVANGVTGVRDMGGVPSLTHDWPRRIDAGELLGPRIVAAGPILDGDPPLHADVSVGIDGPEAARAAVRKVREEGYGFAKVYTLLSREAYFALAEEAGRLDFPFAGHPSGWITPVEASEAGQHSIEHLAYGQPDGADIDLACVDGDGCVELLQTFVRNGTWQVPTLVLLRAKAYSEESSYIEDPRLRYMPAVVRADFEASRARRMKQATPERVARWRLDWSRNLRLVGLMAAAGVPLAAGTDTGVLFSMPGFSLHDELELMVESGLSPAQALRAATVGAAELLGLERDTGTIAPGMAADLVLLTANPLEEIRATTAIDGVVRAGRWMDREELDGLLERVALAAGEPK